MDRLDLGALSQFAAIVHEGSLTRAAQRLGVSQPALSLKLRSIEARLGERLFTRGIGGCQLTAAGAVLWRAVEPALERLDGALSEISALSRRPGLRILTDFGFASFWLMPRLGAFRALAPGLEVQIVATSAPEAPNSDEVTIRFGKAQSTPARTRLLMAERVLPVAAPGYGMAARGADQEAALLHLELGAAAGWLTWDDWFAMQGQHRPPHARDLRLNTYDLVIQAAVAGEGLALGWLPLVEPHLAAGTLVAVGPEVQRPTTGYWLDRGAHEGVAARLFSTWIHSTLA